MASSSSHRNCPRTPPSRIHSNFTATLRVRRIRSSISTSTDTAQPGGYKPFDLDGDPETFNAAERTVIQQAWHSISEDFIPWNIDVTTELPDSNQDWGRSTSNSTERWD